MEFGLSNLLKSKSDGFISILESRIGMKNQAIIITASPNNSENRLKTLSFNDAFCRQTIYFQRNIIGPIPAILQGPKTCSNTLLQINDAIKNERSSHREMVNYDKDEMVNYDEDKEQYWIKLTPPTLFIDGKGCDYFIRCFFKQTDQALPVTKSHSNNTHSFLNLQLQLGLIQRTNLEKELRNIIIKDKFFLVYQSKVSPDNDVVGIEILPMWRHLTKNIISPAEFTLVAQGTSLIIYIDDIVADERNEVILSTIIGIADRLNLDLVVEGIEIIEQTTLLNKLGAKVYEDFYFSKPLTESNLIKFIARSVVIEYRQDIHHKLNFYIFYIY